MVEEEGEAERGDWWCKWWTSKPASQFCFLKSSLHAVVWGTIFLLVSKRYVGISKFWECAPHFFPSSPCNLALNQPRSRRPRETMWLNIWLSEKYNLAVQLKVYNSGNHANCITRWYWCPAWSLFSPSLCSYYYGWSGQGTHASAIGCPVWGLCEWAFASLLISW